MYNTSDLKTGVVIEIGGAPYLILEAKHLKLGRGGAIVQTKLKNLINNTSLEKNFKGAEKVKEADIDKKNYQFLYYQGNDYFFMDSVSFEQITLDDLQVSNTKNFLKEGLFYNILFFQDKPVSVKLPIKINFKVTKTEPATKGDTVSKATKKATIETGFTLRVPLFIKEEDLIKIDTRNGQYLERSNFNKSK
jgi:elongation factor P